MRGHVRQVIGVVIVAVSVSSGAAAQVLMRPTPAPIVTAETERWYLNGDPISYAGNLYYPAGAQVFFNANEMVRSGSHMGVPIYTRTTIEPFSIVYVPLAGGRMQPYERPRAGDVVGTAGSQPASLLTRYEPASASGLAPQAPAPPLNVPPALPIDAGAAAPTSGVSDSQATRSTVPAVGSPRSSDTQPGHVRIGGRPQGINAIYVDYANRRWYSAGSAVEVDQARMIRIGDYRGFAVWRMRGMNEDLIFLASTRDGSLVVPYSTKKVEVIR